MFCPHGKNPINPFSIGLAFSISAVYLTGCGGGGGSSSVISTPTPVPVAEGIGNAASQAADKTAQTSLNSLVTGNTDPSSSAISGVSSQFQTAYNADNSNAQAALGLGITDIAFYAQQVINDAEAVSKSAHVTRAQQTAATSIASVASQAIAWKTSSLTGSTTTGVAKAVTTLPLTLTRATSALSASQYATLETDVSNLNAAITRDLPYIAKAAGYTGLSFPVMGISGATTVTTIDNADAMAIEAAMYVARAATSIALAYNVDYGSFNFGEPLSVAFAGSANGTVITPSQYLPPAPFGNLNSNGASLFASAKSDLNSAASIILTGIPIVEARTTTGHLIPNQNITSANYATAITDVQQFQSALSSSYTSDGVTYNLNAWFTNPPASLRSLEPNWHIQVYTDSYGDIAYGFSSVQSDYPDPTFGGLISGEPAANLTAYAFDGSVTSGNFSITAPNGSSYYYSGDTIGQLAAGGDSGTQYEFTAFFSNTY